MSYKILVATNASSIYTISFSPSSPSLSILNETEIGTQPSWISRTSGGLIIGCLEQPDGDVFIAEVGEKGVNVLGKAKSGGDCPCHVSVSVDGKDVLVANYVSGTVSAIPLVSTSPYLDASRTQTIQLSSPTGPNAERQDQSHAHEVFLLGEDVLVPDLGGDRVYRLHKSAEGKWEIQGYITYPAGHGPRHLASHSNTLYALNELVPSIGSCPLPISSSAKVEEATKTLSKEYPAEVIAAEILIPPPSTSFPNTYIYTSARDIPSPQGDIISILTTSSPPTLIAEIHTGLKHLRGMQFGGPENKYLVAGGVKGGGVKVFERVEEGKGLKEVAWLEKEVEATGFLWLSSPPKQVTALPSSS